MMDELEKRAQSAQIQAMLNDMSDPAKQAMKQMAVAMTGVLGPKMMELGETIAAQHGIIKDEQMQKVQQIAGGAEYLRAYANYQKALEKGTEDQQKAAKQELTERAAFIIENNGKHSALNQQVRDMTAFTGDLRESLEFAQDVNKQATTVASDGVSTYKKITDALEAAKKSEETGKPPAADTKGEGTATQNMSQQLLEAMRAKSDVDLQYAKMILNAATTLDQTVHAMGWTNLFGAQAEGKGPGSGKHAGYGEATGFTMTGYFDSLNKLLSGHPIEALQTGIDGFSKTLLTLTETIGKAAEKIAESTGQPNPHSDGPPGFDNFLSSGDIGQLFENFGDGTLVTAHKDETIMKPNQLATVINKATEPLQGMMSNVRSQFNSDQFASVIQSKFQEATSTMTASAGSNLDTDSLKNIQYVIEELNNTMNSGLRELASMMNKQVNATQELSPHMG
jgi:hypothetical protein